MTFDARSKERLEALGRSLPQKLPLPEPPKTARAAPPLPASQSQGPTGPRPTGPEPQRPAIKGSPGETARHRLEREQDPAALFRALVTASPDGTVPPHLLDRLRELETSRQPPTATVTPETSAALNRLSGKAIAKTTPGTPLKGSKGNAAVGNRRTSRKPGRATEDQDLYTAFAQLLLEDEGDD
jgi:hypothetical protein